MFGSNFLKTNSVLNFIGACMFGCNSVVKIRRGVCSVAVVNVQGSRFYSREITYKPWVDGQAHGPVVHFAQGSGDIQRGKGSRPWLPENLDDRADRAGYMVACHMTRPVFSLK